VIDLFDRKVAASETLTTAGLAAWSPSARPGALWMRPNIAT